VMLMLLTQSIPSQNIKFSLQLIILDTKSMKKLQELTVTIRGFALALTWLEEYKRKRLNH
jgi:hypothetical protein